MPTPTPMPHEEEVNGALAILNSFWDTPPGKLASALLTSIATGLGLWLKQWWKNRETRASTEAAEDEAHQDVSLQNQRLKSALVGLDDYGQRMDLKTRRAIEFWRDSLQVLEAGDPDDIKVTAKTMRYILADLEVEMMAFGRERQRHLRLAQDEDEEHLKQEPPPASPQGGE